MAISYLVYNTIMFPAQVTGTLLFGRNTNNPFNKLIDGGTEPMRVLMLAPDPRGRDTSRHRAEYSAMIGGLQGSRMKDRHDAPWTPEYPLDELPRHLETCKPQILHFSGHLKYQQHGLCIPSDVPGPGDIVTRDDRGFTKRVDGPAFNRVLAHAGSVKLVVFSTHYGNTYAQQLANMMRCPVIVLGPMRSLGDQAPVAFAKQFYRAIGNGVGIEKAIHHAKDLVRVSSPLFRVWLFVPDATSPIVTEGF